MASKNKDPVTGEPFLSQPTNGLRFIVRRSPQVSTLIHPDGYSYRTVLQQQWTTPSGFEWHDVKAVDAWGLPPDDKDYQP